MEKIPNLLCTGRTKNALFKAHSSGTSEFRLFSPELVFCVRSIILIVWFPVPLRSTTRTLRRGAE